jgi:threonine aldolase
MVFLHFTSQEAAQLFTENLANQNINVGMFSKNIVRLVAHLDITDEDLDILFKSLTKF